MEELNTSNDVPEKDLNFFSTATEFSMYIESYAHKSHMTYLEALLEYCEIHMLEPMDIVGKVTKSLKEKLEIDFVNLNYLPRQVELSSLYE